MIPFKKKLYPSHVRDLQILPVPKIPISFVIYISGNELKSTVTVEYMLLKTVPVLLIQSFGSRSAWIHIKLALLDPDPDPHLQYGPGSNCNKTGKN
jgi:hypothetical protein